MNYSPANLLWQPRWDSNPRMPDPKSGVLPVTLRSYKLWRRAEVSIPRPGGPNRFRDGAWPCQVHSPCGGGPRCRSPDPEVPTAFKAVPGPARLTLRITSFPSKMAVDRGIEPQTSRSQPVSNRCSSQTSLPTKMKGHPSRRVAFESFVIQSVTRRQKSYPPVTEKGTNSIVVVALWCTFSAS